jgi:hypothetical protein
MKPARMDEKDWLVWCDANERLWGVQRSESPCRDCLPLFHADMVAGGQCDGTPLPGEREPAKAGRRFASETDRRRYWAEHRRASRERARAVA